jgi:MerR family transcriptional regulator, thiopeptide resistance regulator
MYTVRQLAKLAGISPRTLHYYDEIGLLHPARKGANGYRYYDESSLLRLQQILLYRALDMPLERIRRILGRRDFDALRAMETHAEELRKRIRRMERLIGLAESTILHLKGEKAMSVKQMFEPFSEGQQAEYEKEAMQLYDPATVKASAKKWKAYTPAEKQKIGEEGNAVYRDFLLALPRGAASPEAQACVERWRRHLEYFWTPALDQLPGLADLYNSDPRFKANFDKLDPNLASFVREAVRIYVQGKSK